MGGICSNNSSVGVVEVEQPRAYDHHQAVAKDLGSFEFSIGDWKSLINKLRSNKALEHYALSRNRQQFSGIDDLVSFMAKSPASNETERAWVIYVWVAHNIEYDGQAFSTGNYGSQDADSVLKHGRSVCEGYATLYKTLCDHLDIKCEKISGYAKGFGYQTGTKFTKTDHAWNAVLLANKWYLVEATWAAGSLSGQFVFTKRFEPYFFCCPAQVFVYTHFPENNETHTRNVVSLRQFEELPLFNLDYFLMGLNCKNYMSAKIVCTKSPLCVEFTAAEDTQLIGHLEERGQQQIKQIKNAVIDQRDSNSDNQALLVTIPAKNTDYSLKLYARKVVNSEEAVKMYSFVGEFIVNRTRDEVNTDIPKYAIRFEHNVRLVSHFSTVITCAENPLKLEFDVLPSISFKADLKDSNDNSLKDVVIYQRSVDQKKYEVNVALPKKNELYKLNLFAKAGLDSSEVLKSIGKLWLKRVKGDQMDEVNFFQIFSGLEQLNAHVFSPLEQYLKRNHVYTFKMYAKSAEKVALVHKTQNSDEWIQLQGNTTEKVWTTEHGFDQSGKLQLFIMVENQWKGICAYEVV